MNKIKGNYEEQEVYEKQRNEQINTMINNYKQFKMDNRRINVYPNSKIKNNIIDDTHKRGKSNDLQKKKNNSLSNNNEFKQNISIDILEKAQNKNGINIKEINNRLKNKKLI